MRYLAITALAAAFMIGCSSEATPTTETAEASAALAAKLPQLSGEYVWSMVEAESRLQFLANYNGDFTAEFEAFQTAIRFDPDDLTSAEIHAIVDLSSLQAKSDDVKNNLPSKDWFHTEEHPYAKFSSANVTAQGSQYLAYGDLTIKGITNPAEMTFTLDITGRAVSAKGEITLSRMDYNVGMGSDFKTEDWVKFPVQVMVDIKATR